jgi:glycosyltransferase involved in cell wall biosynthesis
MNIAIVIQSLRSVGGAENVVAWLAVSLAERGHAVTVFTRDFSEDVWGRAEERPYAVHLLGDGTRRIRSSWVANREAGRRLADALLLYAFDVVNAHNHPASLWVHYAKAAGAKLPPSVLFLHNLPGYLYEEVTAQHLYRLSGLRNTWSRYRPKRLFRKIRQKLLGYQDLDRAAVRSFDRVTANSRYTAEMARGIYSREVEPCVLGVRPGPLSGSGGSFVNESASGREDAQVVLTVARIERQKNFDTLLAAIRILKAGRAASGRSFRYVVAGGGPLLEHYRARCRRLRIDDVVAFLGSVPHDRIREVYEKASFLVHIPLDEPFGLVPLEAALCGKASVVSDHGGPAEVVVDGVTGVHVDALDPAAVAAKIGHLLDRPALALEMGERAHSRVLEHYTWDRFTESFERYLVQMCASPAGGAR